MKKTLIITTMLLLSMACTSCAGWQNGLQRNVNNFINKPASIQCFSGGKEILKEKTNGKVTDDPDSDGFFYRRENGEFVEVSADCIFTYN